MQTDNRHSKITFELKAHKKGIENIIAKNKTKLTKENKKTLFS